MAELTEQETAELRALTVMAEKNPFLNPCSGCGLLAEGTLHGAPFCSFCAPEEIERWNRAIDELDLDSPPSKIGVPGHSQKRVKELVATRALRVVIRLNELVRLCTACETCRGIRVIYPVGDRGDGRAQECPFCKT